MPGDYADPSVLKDGEDYYVTHSPFHYQPGFLIWHSLDLLHWEPVCRVGSTWSGSAWAPDLQKVGDTYYIKNDSMKKVKIAILKTMLNEDLVKEYGIPGLKEAKHILGQRLK